MVIDRNTQKVTRTRHNFPCKLLTILKLVRNNRIKHNETIQSNIVTRSSTQIKQLQTQTLGYKQQTQTSSNKIV